MIVLVRTSAYWSPKSVLLWLDQLAFGMKIQLHMLCVPLLLDSKVSVTL